MLHENYERLFQTADRRERQDIAVERLEARGYFAGRIEHSERSVTVESEQLDDGGSTGERGPACTVILGWADGALRGEEECWVYDSGQW